MRYLVKMMQLCWRALSGVLFLMLLASCSSHARIEDGTEANASLGLEKLSVPLDLQEVEIGEGRGYRGIFLKLTRLPDSVSYSSASDPARIILEIKGPTGTHSPEERIPSGDEFASGVRVSRDLGLLRVVVDLQADDPPVYSVHNMADWIMIRLGPPS